MAVKNFRKLPVTIQAVQLMDSEVCSQEQWEEHVEELHNFLGTQDWNGDQSGIYIETLEGQMFAGPGDWIIKGVKGEFYPCKDEIFALTYEEVK